ncbi:MAG: hypothetical protein MUC34_00540 [Anaerolineae bacterium]|jgi:hypothetical protein|nr:hypothetical protein [Anaerolineae bacterium]
MNQVIRPFGLQDIWLVRRLQHTGMTLAVEHMLTHPHEPLWTALTAPWPWAGVGVATFVLDEKWQGQPLQGFAQLMKRASRPEADLFHIAPALLAATPGGPAETVWSRLLSHCSLAAATHGLQRIYASAPEGCFEQTSLRQAGFCLYARETLYRLAETPSTAETLIGLRPQHPRDSWSLQRLYARGAPRLVQQAEGALDGEVGTPILSWWEPHEWEGFVWEPAGEVRGAVQTHRGRAGHWLRVLGAGELSAREVRLLIAQGLRRLETGRSVTDRRRLPVYVTVREYDMNLSASLIGFGFAPFAERARFVKHTAAVVRAAEPLPALARQAAVAHQGAPEMARHKTVGID